MRPELTVTLSAALALLLGACSGSPWDNPKLSDPQEQTPLSNGVVVSLGSGSFTIASTLLELSAAEQWPDPVKLTQQSKEGAPNVQGSTLAWGEAQLAIEQVNLSASALGLEAGDRGVCGRELVRDGRELHHVRRGADSALGGALGVGSAAELVRLGVALTLGHGDARGVRPVFL